jgi:hypothetical protein
MPTTPQHPTPVHVHHKPKEEKPVNKMRTILTHGQFACQFPSYQQILVGVVNKVLNPNIDVPVNMTAIGDWWFARGFQAYWFGQARGDCPLREFETSAAGVVCRAMWLDGWDSGSEVGTIKPQEEKQTS